MRPHGHEASNFEQSFADGHIFAALMHDLFPAELSLAEAAAQAPAERLGGAFEVAQRHGVLSLLDPDDVVKHPETKSITLYVSSLYKAFQDIKA